MKNRLSDRSYNISIMHDLSNYYKQESSLSLSLTPLAPPLSLSLSLSLSLFVPHSLSLSPSLLQPSSLVRQTQLFSCVCISTDI